MDTNLKEIISEQTKIQADFRQYLVDDGKADRTVQSYVTDVCHFMAYLIEVNPKRLTALTRQDVTLFRSHMVQKSFKPATVNKAVNSLSGFCQWLQATGLHPEGQKLVDSKRDRVKVAAMSSVLSQSKVQQQVGLSVMKMALGVEVTNGDSIASLASGATKIMESSVQPNLGANLDVGA